MIDSIIGIVQMLFLLAVFPILVFALNVAIISIVGLIGGLGCTVAEIFLGKIKSRCVL